MNHLALDTGEDHPFTKTERYFRLVASLNVSSSVIKSYFSRTKYIKNKHRSLLTEKTVSATMNLRELSTPSVETLSSRDPDPYHAITLSQHSKNDYVRKYVDSEISKPFLDPDDGTKKRFFRGVITDVIRGEVNGTDKWLIHVQYDSDSDEEDLEE